MEEYLKASEVIDWQHPTIVELAKKYCIKISNIGGDRQSLF
jgi:hypothetical protein